MEVVSALNHGPIFRLKKTWTHVDAKHVAIWTQLTELMSPDNNYAKLREVVRQFPTNESKLPYVGLLLQDFLAVEEIPTLTSQKLINLTKMRKITAMLDKFQAYKAPLYKLEAPPNWVKEYITTDKLPIITEEKEQFALSRLCEAPKTNKPKT